MNQKGTADKEKESKVSNQDSQLDERKEMKGKMKIDSKIFIETTTPDKQLQKINSKEKSQVVTVSPGKLQ